MAAPTSLPALDWLRVFEACARRENFTAAAAELGITQATVSQQIRLLEDRLRVPLFIRLPRGVALTAEGAAYLPHVQTALRSLALSTDALFGARRTSSVALRSPISFAVLWLAPRLPQLAETLPHVRLSLRTVHLPADYSGGEAVLDIRYGTGSFPGRSAVPLTRERLVPAAAPALAARAREEGGWAGAPLIAVSGARELWTDWFARQEGGVPPPAMLEMDSYVAAHEAAKAGAGVVLASRPLADADLAAGSLVALTTDELPSQGGHALTWPAGAALSTSEQELVAWLSKAAA